MTLETSQRPQTRRGVWPLVAGYGATVLLAAAVFALIQWAGQSLTATASGAAAGPAATPHHDAPLSNLLIALVAIISTGMLLSRLFALAGQPRVIGEVIAGILLGPSLLGRIAPGAMEIILPTEVAPYLGVVAQLGIILYMFLVGLELNAGLLRSQAHSTIAISHTSILVPFVLGAGLALWLYPQLAPENVPFTSFSLFLGVAMSVTAFPVLARILTDRRMDKSPLGVIALSCAAADDVTAWCLLAFVVGVTQAEVGAALRTIAFALVYILVMVGLVRPFATRLLGGLSEHQLTPRVTAWVVLWLLGSALTTELIGIHAIFGAFMLGAVIPHDSAVARVFTRKLEDIVAILLLPAFFAYTGMRTEISLVSTPYEWFICGVIIVVATAGKFGGTLFAARYTGLSWRDSTSLGILMNTRGLMELIVLNIGLDLGVMSPTLFAMMVIMALATTLLTTPAILMSR